MKSEKIGSHGEGSEEISGERMVAEWRRSYVIAPPKIFQDDPRHPINDRRYSDVDPALLPSTESLGDVLARMRDLFEQEIKTQLQQGKRLLIVCHGSSIESKALRMGCHIQYFGWKVRGIIYPQKQQQFLAVSAWRLGQCICGSHTPPKCPIHVHPDTACPRNKSCYPNTMPSEAPPQPPRIRTVRTKPTSQLLSQERPGSAPYKSAVGQIVYNLNMFYIYNEGVQSTDWESAYHTLHQRFTALAASLQQAVDGEAQLRLKIRDIRSENQRLKLTTNITRETHSHQNECSSFDPQLPESDKQKTAKPPKKRQPRIKKQSSTEMDSIGEASIYECTYHDCGRVYSSPVSLNLHIKTKHNGGTKKEREAYAKMIIEAEERGDPIPKVELNFPPNFLKQFKVTYEYMKKYNM